MHKKISTLILAIACVSTQCREIASEQIKIAQIKAAARVLQNPDKHFSRASMGIAIVGLGLGGSLAAVALNKNNLVFHATCASAVMAGSYILWTGENEQGNPQERERLILIIENAGSSEQTNNTSDILTNNDK